MKSVVLGKDGAGVQVIDKPEPQIVNPTDVKIKLEYATVCGSDLHMCAGAYPLPEGWPMGHEGTGTIMELGPDVKAKGLKVGDKATFYFNKYCGTCYYCRNGQEHLCTNVEMLLGSMSEYIVVSEQQVYKLDDDADMAAASLIEPISCCMHGVDMCNIKSGMSVAIAGGGGMGQLTLQLVKMAGAVDITMIEPIEWKRTLALENGADHAIDPINEDLMARTLEITDGRKFDVVIEVSGAASSVKSAYEIAGRGGVVEYLATYRPGVTLEHIDLAAAFPNEITVITNVYQSPYVLPRSVKVYKNMNLAPLIEHVYSLDECTQAFEDQRDGKSLKSLFKI